MISPKVMKDLGKLVNQGIKPLSSQNDGQLQSLKLMMKMLGDADGGGGGPAKSTKDLTSTLLKITKLVEAQNQLLGGIKVDDVASDGGDDLAKAARELEATVKEITDENRKQARELEDLIAEVEKAGKDAGDKESAKRIKAATQALEKAAKLIDEQSKLLDEARRALAG